MHPTQHSTIARKRTDLEPRILRTHRMITRGSAREEPETIACTDEDILRAIDRAARHQSTRFVMLAAVRVDLGLSDDERAWFLRRIEALDAAGRVLLSPLEQPQALALYQAAWSVRNASGVVCHEVTLAAPLRSQPVLPMQPMPAPPWPRAASTGSLNPTVQHERIGRLLREAAETLSSLGKKSA